MSETRKVSMVGNRKSLLLATTMLAMSTSAMASAQGIRREDFGLDSIRLDSFPKGLRSYDQPRGGFMRSAGARARDKQEQAKRAAGAPAGTKMAKKAQALADKALYRDRRRQQIKLALEKQTAADLAAATEEANCKNHTHTHTQLTIS